MRRTISSLADDRLAVEVAAALRVDLVLDVAAGEAGVLQELRSVRATFIGSPKPVSASIERRQVGHPGDLLAARGDLG